jgi:hypothetical protein
MAIIRMDGGYIVTSDSGEVLGKFIDPEAARKFFDKRVSARMIEIGDYYR